MMRYTTLTLAALALVFSIGGCSRSTVTIEQAWVRTPLPGRSMTAGYLVVHNPTPHDLVVTGARVDAFGDVSVHETRTVEGVSRMFSVNAIRVAAGKSVTFRPGGLHLMLMQPRREIARGDTLSIALEFDDGKIVSATALVSDTEPQ